MTPEVVKVNHACPALGKWIINFQGVHNMAWAWGWKERFLDVIEDCVGVWKIVSSPVDPSC